MALYGKVVSISTITRDGVLTIRPECPRTGTKTRAVHKWIYYAATQCMHFCRTLEQAFEIIAAGTAGCGRVVTAREINDTLANVYGSGTNKRTVARPSELPKFDPELLWEIASHVPFEVTDDWLAEVSSECVLDVTPGKFLDSIFRRGECVWVGKHDADVGGFYHPGDSQEASDMVDYLRGSFKGAKYLINPTDGQGRKEVNLTGFRHLLIESDKAPRDLWLRMIVQVHAPILALYESGKRSIHAVIRLSASNKEEFMEQANYYRRHLIPVGADKNAGNKPVQLTRLPGIMRRESGQMQRLLYLAPDADGTPIWKKETLDQ
jgi:hypothetical protein